MSWLDDLLNNARNTPPIQGLQNALQQYGYNREQGVPLMQGGTGNSVIKALTTGQIGKAQAYSDPNPGSGGGGGGGGAGGDNFVDTNYLYNTGGGSSGGSVDTTGIPDGGGTNDGGLGAMVALARQAYQNRLNDLSNVFNQARDIYDQGVGLVNKRRGEFKDIFDTGNNDILTRFEQERGNLQRSSTENKNRLRNILRATGMGGSALVRGIGSQDKANLRNLGSLAGERTANERENLSGYNANQDWANQQETSLGNFLQGAQNDYFSGVNNAGLVNQGDVGQINSMFDNLRNNIYAQKAALEAARGNVSGYQANPFAPTISNMVNSLNAALPSFSNNGTDNQAANINPNQTYFDLLRQRAGGSLYA